jgi:NDP-sugar pyrophosphorylase family protein
MIEYTVEFLAQNGVEEIYLVCVWHSNLIQDYVVSIVIVLTSKGKALVQVQVQVLLHPFDSIRFDSI